jgi:hypothetical protein
MSLSPFNLPDTWKVFVGIFSLSCYKLKIPLCLDFETVHDGQFILLKGLSSQMKQGSTVVSIDRFLYGELPLFFSNFKGSFAPQSTKTVQRRRVVKK